MSAIIRVSRAVMALCLLCFGTALAQTPTLSWTYQGVGFGDGTATGDLDGDGLKEIAQKFTDQGLVVLDHDGSLLWHGPADDRDGIPAFADVDGDGMDEIVSFDWDDSVTAFDADGSVLWRDDTFSYPGDYNTTPTIADFDGDGDMELAVVDWNCDVASLDLATGRTQWKVNFWGDPFWECFASTSAAASDLDGDGKLELVFWGTSRGYVMALNAEDGSLQWSSDSFRDLYGDRNYSGGPAVADIDADGYPEIAVLSSYGYLLVLNHDGSLRFRVETRHYSSEGYNWSCPVIGDVDGDGALEVVTYSFRGVAYVFDASGTLEWSRPSDHDRAWWVPMLADVNGDGVLDVLVADYVSLQALDVANRTVIFDLPMNATPWLAEAYPSGVVDDLDGDGKMDILAPGWADGVLYAWELDTPAPATSWQYMGTLLRTGTPGASAPSIEELGDFIESFDLGGGFESALLQMAGNALDAFEQGNTEAAAGILGALINAVEAQAGKAISWEDAEAIMAYLNHILGQL